MKKSGKDIWRGLQPAAVAALSTRDYRAPALAKRLAGGGVEAGQIVWAKWRSLAASWIPGVGFSAMYAKVFAAASCIFLLMATIIAVRTMSRSSFRRGWRMRCG